MMLSPASPKSNRDISGVHSLAHTHSVSMSRFEGDPVRPSSKNLADIANHLPSPPPVYVPDRSPDAMKERRERKQAHRLMLHDNPKAFNRRKVRGSLSTFLEEGMAMKHLVGEVHQPRDHLNVCHPKAGYTYSRMTKDVSAHRRRREPAPYMSDILLFLPAQADGPEFYDCEYSSVRPRTVGYSPGHNRSLAASPSQGSLNSALSLGSPTRFNTRSEADTYIIANKKVRVKSRVSCLDHAKAACF